MDISSVYNLFFKGQIGPPKRESRISIFMPLGVILDMLDFMCIYFFLRSSVRRAMESRISIFIPLDVIFNMLDFLGEQRRFKSLIDSQSHFSELLNTKLGMVYSNVITQLLNKLT